MTSLTHSFGIYQHEPLEHPRRCLRLCSFATKGFTADSDAIDLEIAHYSLHNVSDHDDFNSDGLVYANFEKDDQVVSFTDANNHRQCTSYTAVSYCWGKDTTSKTVSLNGQDFVVSENLHNLLTVLRDGQHNQRLLWIDQLCINQVDVYERNNQVSLMSYIYSSAESVYVWLGNATPETGLGLRTLEQLETSAVGLEQMHEDNVVETSKEIAAPHDSEGLLALKSLLTREYWTRLWIVQEVVYARKLFLLCGKYKYHLGRNGKPTSLKSWNKRLSDASQELDLSQDVAGVHESYVVGSLGSFYILPRTLELLSDFFFMLECRKEYHGKNGTGYLNSFGVVEDHSWRRCRDPRDRIFGLQSLIAPGWGVPIDYTKSTEEVFEAWVAETAHSSHGGIHDSHELRKAISSLYSTMGLGSISQQYMDRLVDRSFRPQRIEQPPETVSATSRYQSLLLRTAQLRARVIRPTLFCVAAVICASCLLNSWWSEPHVYRV